MITRRARPWTGLGPRQDREALGCSVQEPLDHRQAWLGSRAGEKAGGPLAHVVGSLADVLSIKIEWQGWGELPTNTGEEPKGHWEVSTRGSPEPPEHGLDLRLDSLIPGQPPQGPPAPTCQLHWGSRKVSENYKAMANSLYQPGHGHSGCTGH